MRNKMIPCAIMAAAAVSCLIPEIVEARGVRGGAPTSVSRGGGGGGRGGGMSASRGGGGMSASRGGASANRGGMSANRGGTGANRSAGGYDRAGARTGNRADASTRAGNRTGNRADVTNRAGNRTGNRTGNTANIGNRANINSGNTYNRNVNIDADNGWGGWDDDYHPVAAGMAFGAAAAVTSAAIGSMYYSLPPACSPQPYASMTYYNCGGAWYQPQYQGDQVVYVVVDEPN